MFHVGGDPVAEYRRAVETVAAADPDLGDVRLALSGLVNVRRDLDRVERELIGAARDRGLSWTEVAEVLGLRSRQAAEQRWLRLTGGSAMPGGRDPDRVRRTHKRQRVVDIDSGPELAELRRAAVEMSRRIAADRAWDERHSRAVLARTSLASAVEAEPSALYALCRNAIDDFDAMSPVRLPAVLAGAVRRFRRAVTAAGRSSRTG